MTYFNITHTDGNARVGQLTTKSGVIETPFFMPVITKATGKYITTDDYNQLSSEKTTNSEQNTKNGSQNADRRVAARAVICNSLLLSLRPGTDVIKSAGGLNKFMNFKGITFTDSGGFQASSAFYELKSKKAIHFRSPYDNKKIILTPKTAMQIQWDISSDVAMVLDDMTPPGANKEEARIAVDNTYRWAKESLQAHREMRENSKQQTEHSEQTTELGSQGISRQLLFGISQGNFFPDLREESAKQIAALDFDGFAIGGVAIGEPLPDMYKAVDSSIPFLPKDKPRYVMGLGSPMEILEMIGRGVDCFDSIYPTQNARHSNMFTKKGKLVVDKAIYTDDFTPIEKDCKCNTCLNYTKAYLHHLTKIDEPAAKRLKSIHNQYFMQQLVEDAKTAIKEKRYKEFLEEFKKYW